MPSDRTIAALRALAERPGTPAEGALAREILARLTGRNDDEYQPLRDYLRREISLEDLLNSLRAQMPEDMTHEEAAFARGEQCACGAHYPVGGRCPGARHETIRLELINRFPVGSEIQFSGRTGTVVCHHPRWWNQITVKFPSDVWAKMLTVYKYDWLASPVVEKPSEVGSI